MDRRTRREILGTYHVATFPGWRAIVEAQARRLVASGLLAETSRVLVGVVGEPAEDLAVIDEWLGRRAEIRHLGPLGAFEFPTLQWLIEEAKGHDSACWYVDTKGVSTGSVEGATHRGRMELQVVDNWAGCLEVLRDRDACGMDWRHDRQGPYPPHFSGNFWWANAAYLRTLPPRTRSANRTASRRNSGSPGIPRSGPSSLVDRGDQWSRPSAWQGLEGVYRDLLGDFEPVRRIVDLGVDYDFSTFQFAEDFPLAEVIGIDNFNTFHADAEPWVRSHQGHFIPTRGSSRVDPRPGPIVPRPGRPAAHRRRSLI